MKAKARRSGFTLIEVLIVVVIMAVLAATILPQFSSATKDAKESAFKFNLHTLRSQIELYKVHHLGASPIWANNTLEQLVKASDASGAVSATGAQDATHPYGPYVQNGKLPPNPYNGLTTVKLDAGTGKPAADGSSGWIYRQSTGEIWPDNADLVNAEFTP